IIGWASDRGASRSLVRLFGWMLLADAVVFVFGLAWLLVVANLVLQAGGALPQWLQGGDLLATGWNGAVPPFSVRDIVKMAFAAATVAGAWTLVHRQAG